MKSFSLGLLALVLASDVVYSFVGNGWQQIRHAVVPNLPETALYASNAEYELAESRFPYDESVVQEAYAEWREMFGKGGFDASRYEIFARNFKTLTMANLDARNQAIAEGMDPPGWMHLNEYGDFTMEEYRGMQDANSVEAPANPQSENTQINSVSNEGERAVEQPVEQPALRQDTWLSDQERDSVIVMDQALQYAQLKADSGGGPLDPQVVQREANLRASYQDCPRAYQEWCKYYGKEPDAIRFATFSNNYVAMREYAEQSGRSLVLNQFADCTREEYIRIVTGPPPGSEGAEAQKADEEAKQKAAEQNDNSVTGVPNQQRPTLVIPKSAQPQQRGTQVIPKSGQTQRRPTLVIPKAAGQGRATQVISTSKQGQPTPGARGGQPQVRGTQVVAKYDRPIVRATEVVSKSTPKQAELPQTAYISKTPQQGTQPRGTKVIANPPNPMQSQRQSSTVMPNQRGTQLIQPAPRDGLPEVGGAVPPGTGQPKVAAPSASPGAAAPRSYNQDLKNPRGTFVMDRTNPDRPRGTVVVKGGKVVDQPRGTIVIKRGEKANVKKGEMAKKRGTREIKKTPQGYQPRGTIVIKNDKKGQGGNGEPNVNIPPISQIEGENAAAARGRGTIVIKRQIPDNKPASNPLSSFFGRSDNKKADTSNAEPVKLKKEADGEKSPVFSLFGGTRTSSTGPRSVRGTIVLQRKGTGSSFANGATRKTVLVPKSDVDKTVPSVFSFFGGAKKVEEEEARDPNKRPTLIIKKPENEWAANIAKMGQEAPNQPPSQGDPLWAQLERQRLTALAFQEKKKVLDAERERQRVELQKSKERAAKARKEKLETEQNRGAPAKKPAATKPRRTTGVQTKQQQQQQQEKSNNPLAAFFGTPKPKEVPEVRRWKQNADGSITGRIYNSKNFKDGTRVTTSPVPMGAPKKDAIVKTKSGSQYLLK